MIFAIILYSTPSELTMNPTEALEKLLPSYTRYYDVKKENVTEPFTAEAEFHAHNEQYVLVKAAKIAEIDSNEYVFFGTQDNLTAETFNKMDSASWGTGLSRVNPAEGHRNSDVTLVIICNTLEDTLKKQIKKTKHSKTYKWGIRGWSNFNLIVCELSTSKLYYNRLGGNYKKLVGTIFN